MNGGSGFQEIMSDIGNFLLELLVSAMWGLYMLISFVFTKISAFLDEVLFFLPSTSKMLKEEFISGTLLIVFVVYVIVMNVSAFNLFRKDKIKAKMAEEENIDEIRCRRIERISERRLLTRCFLGGAFGGYLAMKICRHKTLKPKFSIGVPVMLIIQILLTSFVLGYFIFWLCMS